jgi:hypothetical protein
VLQIGLIQIGNPGIVDDHDGKFAVRAIQGV